MRIVAQFNPFDALANIASTFNYISGQFDTQVPGGSLLKMTVYNRSPIDLIFTFSDPAGSTDIVSAYDRRHFEIFVPTSVVKWKSAAQVSNIAPPTMYTQVYVVVYEPGETVVERFPTLIDSNDRATFSFDTFSFTGSENPTITYNPVPAGNGLTHYIDGFDIYCSPLPASGGGSPRILLINGLVGSAGISWQYWLSSSLPIQDHVPLPTPWAVLQTMVFSIVFTSTIGTAQGTFTIHSHFTY